MANSIISVKDTSLVQIKLSEVNGSAHITVNERYFSLRAGETVNISASLVEGANVVKLAVAIGSSSTKPLDSVVQGVDTLRGLWDDFPGKREWMARFELYIDGDLAGSYIRQGRSIGRSREHIVATIGLNIVKDASTPTVMQLVNRLQKVEGIAGADKRDFNQSNPHFEFKNGVAVRTWKNFIGVDYVFVTNRAGECVYGGYVGWLHTKHLQSILEAIYEDLQEHMV